MVSLGPLSAPRREYCPYCSVDCTDERVCPGCGAPYTERQPPLPNPFVEPVKSSLVRRLLCFLRLT